MGIWFIPGDVNYVDVIKRITKISSIFVNRTNVNLGLSSKIFLLWDKVDR